MSQGIQGKFCAKEYWHLGKILWFNHRDLPNYESLPSSALTSIMGTLEGYHCIGTLLIFPTFWHWRAECGWEAPTVGGGVGGCIYTCVYMKNRS